jgi:Kef-type K+ transport system membrane component KefB
MKLFFFIILLLSSLPVYAGSGGAHGVIANIALSVVAAGLFGVLVRLISLPPILGYLLGGVAIGPIGLGLISDPADIQTISSIGLILLLFMIGMEMDVRKMLTAGRWVLVPGLIQFPLSVLLVVLGSWAFQFLMPEFSKGWMAAAYIGVALALSSTMIVVKILYETREINSLAGRLSLGILIFQDLWAIVVLALQPELSNPEWTGIAMTFMSGLALIVGALLATRYILPIVFNKVSNQPELILILSLGWCFLVSLIAAQPWVGLSMEMGALIAGITLGTFPYNHDVMARAVSLRDFFITLFFVALGMQIAVIGPYEIFFAAAIGFSLPFLRFATVLLPLVGLRAPVRAGIEASVHLSQMSEFSLVIAAIGVTLGHISPELLGLLVWVFAMGAVSSGVIGQHVPALQKKLQRALVRMGLREDPRLQPEQVVEREYDVLFLGLGRIGSAFINEMHWHDPEACAKIGVVESKPKDRIWLESMGVKVHYGDIAHPVTFSSLKGIRAKVVVSGVPDAWLKGTNNSYLLKMMQRFFPKAYYVVNTSSLDKAELLYAKGAHHVLIPEQMAGHALADQVRLVLERKAEEAKIQMDL